MPPADQAGNGATCGRRLTQLKRNIFHRHPRCGHVRAAVREIAGLHRSAAEDVGITGELHADQLSADALAKMAETYERLQKGEIVPPTTADKLNDFPGLK